MTNNGNQITYFGKADYRNKMTPFGIKATDRTRHVYAIGKTGMGKSTLLENMAVQDIQSGNGLGFIDPHGGSVELLLDYVPEDRIKDVIYFAPFDTDYPVAFNIMEDVGKDKRHLVASGLMSAFKKIWVDAWSARMEYILGNTLLALLEFPGATLLGVNRMYSDKDYRKAVVDNITDPSIKSFWVDEYAKYGDRYTQEATPAIQNKIGQFVSNPLIRNIIGQSKSTFSLRDVMDNKKILLMNLSKGKVGDQNTSLLGSMLITKIYLSAMSRADASRSELAELPNFYFFVDEFQSFANESFADILSEARKYKLNLHIAHQYIEQMPEEVRAAVFGNVGTMITFRVGSYDADVLEKEFLPEFTGEDLVNLDKFQMYLRLMIDGVGSKPFSAAALPPIAKSEHPFTAEILESSRRLYGRPRAEVESEILEWHHTNFAPQKPTSSPPSGADVPKVFSPMPNAPYHVSSQPQPQTPRYDAPRNSATPSSAPYRREEPRSESFSERRQFDRRHNEHGRTSQNEPRREFPDRRVPPRPVISAPTPVPSPVLAQAPAPVPVPAPVLRQEPLISRPERPEVRLPVSSEPSPISLAALKKDRGERAMEPTEQNKNSLKHALQTLMKEKQPDSGKRVSEIRDTSPKQVSIPRKEVVPDSAVNTVRPSSTPKEIPEDDLRKMLQVDVGDE